jgi:hypothetical protein
MGDNLEEWMDTLNSMNAKNRWRLGLSRGNLGEEEIGGEGGESRFVTVVPFSQHLLVDTNVK